MGTCVDEEKIKRIKGTTISKEICVWCHKKQRWGWGKRDELRWNDGNITCAQIMTMIKTNSCIPEACPYHLEHLVNKGQKP